MKTITIKSMPSGRFIAYGLSADACRQVMLGGQDGPPAPFVIDRKCLVDLVTSAVREGFTVCVEEA